MTACDNLSSFAIRWGVLSVRYRNTNGRDTMTILETAQAIRQNTKDMNECNNHVRLVRLSDTRWDLTAKYDMLMREAGLEKV